MTAGDIEMSIRDSAPRVPNVRGIFVTSIGDQKLSTMKVLPPTTKNPSHHTQA
jgi:hypothetical protein